MCDGRATGAAALVEELRSALGDLDLANVDDAERLALLRAGEDLTRHLAAVSVRTQVAFAESQVAEQAAAGVPARKRGLAVADDIAAARKTSPSMASRELSSAKALVAEMPLTMQALADGTISAYQARIITEATSCLDPADRAEVDERLQSALAGASNAEIGKAVRALVYEVDPAGFVRRARKAAKDRGVSVRPAPDVMAVLSARLPAQEAIACYAALRSHAVAARASGDPRSLNQLMADELHCRLTGRTVVDGIDVEVELVMTDAALFDGASDPADLKGYGPIPAEMARDLLRHRSTNGSEECGGASDTEDELGADGAGAAPGTDDEFCVNGTRCTSWDCTKLHGVAPARSVPIPGDMPPSSTRSGSADDPSSAATPATGHPAPAEETEPTEDMDHGAKTAKAWVRRLYVDPANGVLTGRDSRRRLFTGSVRAFVIARDRTCRNSWCGAPIRDVDHVQRHRDGGTTDAENGRGLCHRCNLARERPRHHEPSADSYRPPPPAVTTLLGRQPVPTHATGSGSPGDVPTGAPGGTDPPEEAESSVRTEREVA